MSAFAISDDVLPSDSVLPSDADAALPSDSQLPSETGFDALNQSRSIPRNQDELNVKNASDSNVDLPAALARENLGIPSYTAYEAKQEKDRIENFGSADVIMGAGEGFVEGSGETSRKIDELSKQIPSGKELADASQKYGVPAWMAKLYTPTLTAYSSVDKVAMGLASFLTSPSGAAQTGALAVPVVGEAQALKFAYDMIKGGVVNVENAYKAIQDGDWQAFSDNAVGAVANLGLGGKLAHSKYKDFTTPSEPSKVATNAEKPTTNAPELPAPSGAGFSLSNDLKDQLTILGSQLKMPEGAQPTPESIGPGLAEHIVPPDIEASASKPIAPSLPMPAKMEEQLKAAEISVSPGMEQAILDKRIKSPVALQRVFPNLKISLEEGQEILNQVWKTSDNVPEKYQGQQKVESTVNEGDFSNIQRPSKVGVDEGKPLTGLDVPRLESQLKAAKQEAMDAVKSKDPNAYKAAMGKMVYLSGAIEGAKKSGPNFDVVKNEPVVPKTETTPENPPVISESAPKVKQETASPEQATGGGTNPASETTSTKSPEPVNENSSTSIKNAIVDQEREKRGLPPVIEPARRSFGTVWDDATKKVDQDPDAQTSLIDELRGKPRAVTDTEDAMLLQRQIELQNEHSKATEALAKSHDEGRMGDVEEQKIRTARLSDQLLDIYNINKRVGTETGRGLNARRIMANEDYSLAALETKLRAAQDGKPLSDDQRASVNDIGNKISTLQKSIEDYQDKVAGDSTVPRYSEYVVKLAEKIVSTMDKRAEAARLRIKERSKRLNVGIDPTMFADYAEIGASHIAHIGLDLAKWSDAMLKEFPSLSTDDLKKIFEASQKKADGISEQFAPKNEKVKRAVKKQATDNPALKALKTRYANRIDELKAKMEGNDLTIKGREPLKLDAEALKLKAAYENAKLQFDRLVMKERLKNRTIIQKTQDTFVKWRRAFLLSSPVTLAKLTSAAIERTIITPIEEGVGAVYSKVPIISSVAKLAPREGGLSIQAEAKSLRQGFTKGMLDSWQTLKTGHSDMDSLFGKRDVMPREVIDFIGSIHGALKAPVKRAEFERSFEKRIEFAIRNGQDVSDPMMQTKICVEAYKDAQRSIFMQDNKVTAAWNAGIAILKSPDKKTGKTPVGRRTLATAMQVVMPIVKVPTNIVAETMQYAVGSVTGSARLAIALKRGVGTLKPEEADLIMRELKKGSLGASLLLLGYFNPQLFGGYYQANDRREKGHPKFGTVQLGDWNVPSMLIHNPLLETLQIGATIRHVADSKLRKKDNETQGLSEGVIAAALGLTDEVPFVRQTDDMLRVMNPYERNKYVDQVARDMIVPLGISWVAQHFDKDSDGNYVARDPKNLAQTLESAIPILRKRVQEKRNRRTP